jgi:hypothetical protein
MVMLQLVAGEDAVIERFTADDDVPHGVILVVGTDKCAETVLVMEKIE